MILSGREILRHMGKEIIIDPFDERKLNPNSYNLTLHDELMIYRNGVLDMKTRPRRSPSPGTGSSWSRAGSTWDAPSSTPGRMPTSPCSRGARPPEGSGSAST